MTNKKVGRWTFVVRRRDNQQTVKTRSGNLCWESNGASRKEAETKVLEQARKLAQADVFISGAEQNP